MVISSVSGFCLCIVLVGVIFHDHCYTSLCPGIAAVRLTLDFGIWPKTVLSGWHAPMANPFGRDFRPKIVPLGVVAQELLQQQCVLCLGVGAFWRGVWECSAFGGWGWVCGTSVAFLLHFAVPLHRNLMGAKHFCQFF